MSRPTPFHTRTAPLCSGYAWKEWSGYAAVCNYDLHSEREYHAIRHTAGLLDITPLCKTDVQGPDAGEFLGRLWSRNVAKLPVGRVIYGCICDFDGNLLDDGTVSRLGPNHYRMTTSEFWMGWWHQHARGFDVTLADTTHDYAALALQGPAARTILAPLVDIELGKQRFFDVAPTRIGNTDVLISRTGYTGDLGFEIWVKNEHAIPIWDAIVEEGTPHGMEPIGLDALDVARIEAGFVLQGCDYVSARSCLTASRKSTPAEAGLGWTVRLNRPSPFIGQKALQEEAERGPAWDLVGLEISWEGLEQLYAEYGLPPTLSPTACRLAVPIYDPSGQQQIGQATSTTWSPILKKYLALAQIKRAYNAIGTTVSVEHTVEFERRKVSATVVEKPFFDPPRKRQTS